MSLTVLNLAVRAAELFLTEHDPTKLSAVKATLFADALSAGIYDYWQKAPAYVTSPQGETPLATSVGVSTVTLPAHFQMFQRDPWLRLSSAESWCPLTEMEDDPQWGGTTTGRPSWFRVINSATAPVWQDAGADPSTPKLQLWPTPDAVYSIDVWAAYSAPRVRMKHIAGAATTMALPIPEEHLFRIVLPLCGPHMLTHPLIDSSRVQTFMAAAELARRALDEIMPFRTARRGRIGTPTGY